MLDLILLTLLFVVLGGFWTHLRGGHEKTRRHARRCTSGYEFDVLGIAVLGCALGHRDQMR